MTIDTQPQYNDMKTEDFIVSADDKILITGANGFIGTRVVKNLLGRGFTNLCCFVRPGGNTTTLEKSLEKTGRAASETLFRGNLLSPDDARKACSGAKVIFHLAAGVGKSYPTCVLNSVVTTRNLLDAAVGSADFKRFLNVSSFAVYSPRRLKRGAVLDESCDVEARPEVRGEGYCYGKAKQDDLIREYHAEHGIPYVLVRPGAVYGPGKNAITGRVGIDTFGVYLHTGGKYQIPFSFVENCAEAVVLAGIRRGVDGEVFNIVDDDLPTSRDFLKNYKKNVKPFLSLNVPKSVSFLFCYFWEKYSSWSKGQLPPAFNLSRWHAEWQGQAYSNAKIKERLGWRQQVPTGEAMKRYFDYCRQAGGI